MTGQILAIDQADPVAQNTKDIWTFHDLNGNLATVATVDSGGDWSVLHTRYDDFGNIAATFGDTEGTNLVAAPQHWSGMFLDESTGLYDAESRGWYNPQIGRRGGTGGGIWRAMNHEGVPLALPVL